jgi:hypothetical protein
VGDNVKGMLGIPEKRTHKVVAEKMLMYLLVKPSVFN